MSFFRKPPSNVSVNDEIFQAVFENFQYKERKRASLTEEVSEERIEELSNPHKSEDKKVHEMELAQIKGKIAKEFIQSVKKLKEYDHIKPLNLIENIKGYINTYMKLSENVRSHDEAYSNSGGHVEYNGNESYTTKSTSGFRPTTHASGELEKNFSNVFEALVMLERDIVLKENAQQKLKSQTQGSSGPQRKGS